MAVLDFLKVFKPGENIAKGLDVIDQLVEDKDARGQMKAALYLAELQTKTVPIVDALHKLGRQVLALTQIAFYIWAVSHGVPITWELVAGVSGATGLYTAVKGKGK